LFHSIRRIKFPMPGIGQQIRRRATPCPGTLGLVYGLLVAGTLLLLPVHYARAQAEMAEQSLTLENGTELFVSVFPAKGNRLLIWIPSYATPIDTVREIAGQLQLAGVEVWYTDLLEAHFLPKTASSIYKIPGTDIVQLMEYTRQSTDRNIYWYAESRATIPVLKGLRQWQLTAKDAKKFAGVVLNSPYLYNETPDPGQDARLRPIVSVTNLPIFILQPEYSPRYWQLRETVPALEQGGSDVFVQVLKNVRGRFHFRPDATDDETRFTSHFGQLIAQSLRLLDTVNQKPRIVKAVKLKTIAVKGKKDRYLQPYQGDPTPPPLQLETLDGKTMDLRQFKNRVVLVNFWATWCPPCVHEMPSMQRLSKKMRGNPFVIVGVNIAERKPVVEAFLRNKVHVDFPILLDTDGSTMRQWNVMAFPTSFVIDKDGRIRYALFGSIDWDTPDIMNKIRLLVKEN
ncbi:MAG: TlpA disulfide reductase family protein, partial [Gammaproteobacteria bacterium]